MNKCWYLFSLDFKLMKMKKDEEEEEEELLQIGLSK